MYRKPTSSQRSRLSVMKDNEVALEATFRYFTDGGKFAIAELVCPIVDVALSIDSVCETDIIDGCGCRSRAVNPVAVRNALSRHTCRECSQLIRCSCVPIPRLHVRVIHAGRPELDYTVVAWM